MKGIWKLNFLGIENEEILMKKSRFTESQIISVLQQAETSMPIVGLCRELGISNSNFFPIANEIRPYI